MVFNLEPIKMHNILTLSLLHLTKISISGCLVIENPSSKFTKDFYVVFIGESQCVVPSSMLEKTSKLRINHKSMTNCMVTGEMLSLSLGRSLHVCVLAWEVIQGYLNSSGFKNHVIMRMRSLQYFICLKPCNV